jgi:arylsulfatase A-like enzyme
MRSKRESGKDDAMPERPNIIIIITHDTGQHLGAYGVSVQTPHLDQLAASGARFANHFCTGSAQALYNGLP